MIVGPRVVTGVDDPLGPLDQDTEEIRDEACRLVAADRVCSPSAPDRPDPSSGGGGGGGAGIVSLFEVFVWLLFFALVAALIYLIVRAVMNAQGSSRPRRGRGKKKMEDPEAEELPQVAIDHSREPDDWRREADGHRRAGRLRDAVRCRYRALVGDLARRGLIDEIPGRTSGEERSQMSKVAPAQGPAFAAVAELFDEAWFGDVPVTDSDLAQMETLERDVLAGAGSHRS